MWRYALTGREVRAILSNRFVKIDGKVRTDATFPTGFMDVVHIEKTNEYFRSERSCHLVPHRPRARQAAVRRQGAIRRSPHHQGGGQLQALQDSQAAGRAQGTAVRGNARRQNHPIS